MEQFQRILVGVDLEPDGSDLAPGSRRAVEQALWLAELSGGRVRLVHSTWRDRYVDPLSGGAFVVAEGMPSEGRAAIEEALERLRAAGVRAELTEDDDRPHRALARLAAGEEADLVLVGKRSRGENGRRLGSTSRKVVHGSPAPVWVVKPDHVGAVRKVVAATDFTDAGRRAVDFAARFADAAGAELHVVHAVPPGGVFAPDPHSDTLQQAPLDVSASADASRERMERELAESVMAGRARAHVEIGGAHRVIREVVEREEADLLVVGAISRTGVPGLLLGSTAEALVETVDASILAVRAPA